MRQELSVAFIWHFHQPDYRAQPDGIRLMPWARLHAVKDYLDMLLIMDKFPELKLNFSIVPALLDTIEDYAEKEGHDIHSKLTVTPVEELTDDDKLYILNYFFDANYENLIAKNERYNELYIKRFGKTTVGIEDFSLQEYSDIMFLFNCVWFDPVWKNVYPELNDFILKGRNYTLEDRIQLIELNRKIIRQIIPSFKKYQDEGKIEIITSAYNHPILPVLIDSDEIKSSSDKYPMPDFKINLAEDAKQQIKSAIEKIKKTFGKKPKGIWPGEQCISHKTLEMFAESGFEWTITDESVLADSLHKEFVRDFRGCYEDPYDVCSLYEYTAKKNKKTKIIFRDSVIPNLISFEYPHHNSEFCGNDLFDRIKTVYDKLKNSPDDSHLFTIAMDGENCWENYEQDGTLFLEKLYSLLSSDNVIKTVLVSDYIKANEKSAKPLKKVAPGTWGNQDFRLWIAEPTKNLAWQYLINAENIVKEAEKNGTASELQLNYAKREIYTAEGSDWFWWYGEPNNSGQDHIFDFLFREHLKNVYTILDQKVPEYLDMPLIAFMGKPMREPVRNITPEVNGISKNNDEWAFAGCIDIPDGPVLQENKIFNRIYYGADNDNLYLRFDLNNYVIENNDYLKDPFSVYIYIKSYGYDSALLSPVRTTNKTDKIMPVLSGGYTHEIKITLRENSKYNLNFSKSLKDCLWELQWDHDVKHAYKDILEVCIPFKDICVNEGESFEFVFLTGYGGVTENVYPKDIPLMFSRSVDTEKENPSLI